MSKNLTHDMTEGNPVNAILLFALPLFLGNIFQQIYSIVDTMVAGYCLGDSAIAAIGATGTLYGFIINFAWGMNSGFGIIVSRSYGGNDENALKKSIAAMIILDTIIIASLTVLSLVYLRPLLHVIQVPVTIFEEAHDYILVILMGMASAILYNMCSGILRAVGNSKVPLYFLIFSSILNLILDFVFIVFCKWGVAGAAAATVAAEAVSGLLCALYLLKYYRFILPGPSHFALGRDFLAEMLSAGGAMAFMYCIVDFGSVLYQRSINSMGDSLIVAHTAARKIISIFMMPLSSIANAYATFVSQNWGAKAYARISATLKKTLALEIIFGLISCLIVYLFGKQAVALLTNTADQSVIANSYLSIRIHFIFFPVLGILFVLRTTLQSLGQKIIPVFSSGFELSGKILAGYFLIPTYGFLWVCLTEPIIWTVCVIFMAIALLLNKEKLHLD